MSNLAPLTGYPTLIIRQRKELAELFGYESRNKYEILSAEGHPLWFAAEQGSGFGMAFLRQMLGHWRTFEIHVFDMQRNLVLRAVHPFRLFFQRLEVFDTQGRLLGSLQQRFSFARKRFDVTDAGGRLLFEMRSPFLSVWKFPFLRSDRPMAEVTKKWGGLAREMFTDADTFRVDYRAEELGPDERALVLAAGLFIDLLYFEQKA